MRGFVAAPRSTSRCRPIGGDEATPRGWAIHSAQEPGAFLLADGSMAPPPGYFARTETPTASPESPEKYCVHSTRTWDVSV